MSATIAGLFNLNFSFAVYVNAIAEIRSKFAIRAQPVNFGNLRAVGRYLNLIGTGREKFSSVYRVGALRDAAACELAADRTFYPADVEQIAAPQTYGKDTCRRSK